MTTEFTMPMLGEVMEEGRIVAWLKKEGDTVEQGEIVMEVETEKATYEIESPASGVLKEILVPEGETAAVNTLLAEVPQSTRKIDFCGFFWLGFWRVSPGFGLVGGGWERWGSDLDVRQFWIAL